jgi:hypothetical protein
MLRTLLLLERSVYLRAPHPPRLITVADPDLRPDHFSRAERGHFWRAAKFTHAWREVPRDAWGSISVLASVEQLGDIEAARAAGYAVAIVVDEVPTDKAFFRVGSDTKIVPCPAETRGATCIECRLCLDDDKLARSNVAIAFEAHGPTARRVREVLVQRHVVEHEAQGEPLRMRDRATHLGAGKQRVRKAHGRVWL